MICGLFQFDDPAAQQLVRLLPKTITVDAGASPQSEWMQSTLRMISPEAKEMSPGGETIITRLADILVIHAIRFWISHNHSAQTGWLRALHDPHYWQGHFEDSSRPWRTLDACITGPRAAGGAETTSTNILARYGKGEEPDREGTVKYASFTLLGQEFEAMDSAREGKFAFNEAISFIVPCDTQEEIDYFWEGFPPVRTGQCGWLKDRFGVSWQITPTILNEMLVSTDKDRMARVTQAFLKMKKFNIDALKRAYEGKYEAQPEPISVEHDDCASQT